MANTPAPSTNKDASIKLLNSINNAVLLATGKPWVFPVDNKNDFQELVKWLFSFDVNDFISGETEDFIKKIEEASNIVDLLAFKDEVIASKDPVIFNKFNSKLESFWK